METIAVCYTSITYVIELHYYRYICYPQQTILLEHANSK